jgi:uncharacterized protein (DUF2147 family)
MKRLVALAAFLLASTAAQAQYTFDYGGRTIRIDPDRGTVSIPGVYDNTGRRKRPHNDQGSERPRKPTPEQAKVDPKAPAVSPVQNDQTPTPATAPTNTPSPPSATANVAPADPQASPSAAAPSPAPAPIIATVPAAVPLQTPQAPTTSMAQPATTPLGLWLTAEKEGKVRIEQCGANLCGYSVDAKSNQNGEQVLINMKPGNDAKWSGRILDPNTGSTYDSTIALQGSDTLRIQGCAMGGMFCGGQTWSRLN